MDLTFEELQQFEKVVDRLAAQGPSNVRGPHCWFCGSGHPWFHIANEGKSGGCDCKKAHEAREGKRPKPRFNVALNCIENLDEETIRFNETLGFKRYVPSSDGVAITSMAYPKGPGVGRGRGRLHKAALEIIEIELPEPENVTPVTRDITLATPNVTSSVENVTRVTKAPKTAAERKRLQRERDRAAKEPT